MNALLRYHYRDIEITRRLPEHELLRLFAELEWVRKSEKKDDEATHQSTIARTLQAVFGKRRK